MLGQVRGTERMTPGVHRHTAALEALCAAAGRVDIRCRTVSGHLWLGGEAHHTACRPHDGHDHKQPLAESGTSRPFLQRPKLLQGFRTGVMRAGHRL